MKSLLVALLSFILALELCAEGPAGIILYFKDKGTTYFLLADDIRPSKGWSAFGGIANRGETYQQTAARETEEETRGYFKRDCLMKKIQHQKPFSEHGFTMFFVEVPFVPAQRVKQHPIANKFSISMHERVNYAWIPESEIVKAFDTKEAKVNPLYLPRPIRSDFYNRHWIRSMKSAYAQKVCPWQKGR